MTPKDPDDTLKSGEKDELKPVQYSTVQYDTVASTGTIRTCNGMPYYEVLKSLIS